MFRGLRCVRESPPVSTTGAEVVVPLKVVNASSLPKFGLQVRDTLPASFAVTGSSVQLISSLLPGETATLTYGLVPAVRGVYTLGPLEFRGTDPLGLTRFSSSAQEWTSLVVYPRPLEMGKLQTHWHGLRNWSQNEGGRTRGIGGEFFGVREYVFGDEPKHVHWRSTAKRGKLVVSESARGDTGTVAILLDCGLIWDTDTADPQSCPFERAIVATITVAMCFIQGGCPVLLVTGDRGQTRQPLADSIQPLQDALARVQPQAQNDIAAAIDLEAVLIDQA